MRIYPPLYTILYQRKLPPQLPSHWQPLEKEFNVPKEAFPIPKIELVDNSFLTIPKALDNENILTQINHQIKTYGQ